MTYYCFKVIDKAGKVIHTDTKNLLPFCHGRIAQQMANDFGGQVTVTSEWSGTVVGIYDPETGNTDAKNQTTKT